MGPCKASEVATAARLSRPEAYRALENLVHLGFASSNMARPARFEAAEAGAVFRQLLGHLEGQAEDIREAQRSLLAPLDALRAADVETMEKTRFNLLHGWEPFARRLVRMIGSARDEAFVA